MKLTRNQIILASVAGVVVLLFIMVFASINSTQQDMVGKETALTAAYSDNQNELSAYVMTIKETLGIADRKTDKLDKVLTDAVTGRYDSSMSTAKPGSGTLFSAIAEAYPDLSGLDAYNKVQDAVVSGRTAFKNKQSKLLDMLRDYDSWRQSGIIHSRVTSMVGAPSDNLRATIGAQSLIGAAAEAKMYQLVLAKDATDAFNSGVDQGVNTNPSAG